MPNCPKCKSPLTQTEATCSQCGYDFPHTQPKASAVQFSWHFFAVIVTSVVFLIASGMQLELTNLYLVFLAIVFGHKLLRMDSHSPS
jgi:uncharacterized protein (DUF983 family)